MTPLSLCKRSFPLLKPKKAASTRNWPLRSCQTRVFSGSGGGPTFDFDLMTDVKIKKDLRAVSSEPLELGGGTITVSRGRGCLQINDQIERSDSK